MKTVSLTPKIIPDYRTSFEEDETEDLELPEIPTLSDFFPDEMLINRDCEAWAFKLCELEDLTQAIRHYSRCVSKNARKALGHGGLAILDAWTCGSALNVAKKKCKRGTFKNWFHEELINGSLDNNKFSMRTAQRYMQLARKNPTVEKLIGSNPSLRQAYQACGIIPAAPETEKTEISDREAVARTRLLKSVSSIRKKLRQFAGKNITIDKETRKELLDAKKEINRLFASLCG